MFDWCCFGSLRRLQVSPHLSPAGCELLAACMFDWCCLIYTWVLQTTTCISTLITCWLWIAGCLHVWLLLPYLYLGPSGHYMYLHTYHMLAVNCWLPACLIGVALSIPRSFRPLRVSPHSLHAGCELLAACMFDWCHLIYTWVLQTTTCSTTLITCWLWIASCTVVDCSHLLVLHVSWLCTFVSNTWLLCVAYLYQGP